MKSKLILALALLHLLAQLGRTSPVGPMLDSEAMRVSFQGGHREELRASLEALLGSSSQLVPAERAECLRFLSAIYGDKAGGERMAASLMLQLARLEPRRSSLDLQVKPGTDSLFQAIRNDYANWRARPGNSQEMEPYASPSHEAERTRVLPWIAGAAACLAAGAALFVLAGP